MSTTTAVPILSTTTTQLPTTEYYYIYMHTLFSAAMRIVDHTIPVYIFEKLRQTVNTNIISYRTRVQRTKNKVSIILYDISYRVCTSHDPYDGGEKKSLPI